MDIHAIYALIGFLLAAYSVVGNDAVQTLGTFIASNIKVFKWYWLWAAASSVLIATLSYGWATNGGDISFGRLEKIPPVQIQWYHAAAPLILVLLTRIGIPVSTTFLVLSTFASTLILEKMLDNPIPPLQGTARAVRAADDHVRSLSPSSNLMDRDNA